MRQGLNNELMNMGQENIISLGLGHHLNLGESKEWIILWKLAFLDIRRHRFHAPQTNPYSPSTDVSHAYVYVWGWRGSKNYRKRIEYKTLRWSKHLSLTPTSLGQPFRARVQELGIEVGGELKYILKTFWFYFILFFKTQSTHSSFYIRVDFW